ncbi:MAG: class I SAM-dependent methyltransferase [Oscillospiraceae bacterium]|nr:class I SAM-dependent methyltransferase [Oscillospiraceae bacterium]
MPDWSNPQCIKWMKNASEYTGYHRKLSEIIRKHLGEGGSLCDIGSGPGLVDFHLAPFYDSVTCVDISEDAVSLINKEASERGIKNLVALKDDTGTMEGKWDRMLAVLHGRPEDFADRYRFMVREALVIVTYDLSHMTYENPVYATRRNNDCLAVKTELLKKGIAFGLDYYTLSFGQPLESPGDAGDYCRTYYKALPGESLHDCVKRLALETGDEAYPLYIPNEKHLAVFTLAPG